jgi:PAS domain S-box-containing protein
MQAVASYNLEHFFELSPDWLCVAGFDGYFKKINPAVSKTLGYTEEELFSRPINSFVHPADQHQTEHRRDLIRKGLPLLDFENRYLTKTGDTVWLTWTSMPVKTEKVVFAIAKNITHRKRLEEYQRLLQVLGTGGKNWENAPPDEWNSICDIPKNRLTLQEQDWLSEFEQLVRKYAGTSQLNLATLSSELFISERQLHRRIKNMLGVTPNQFIRVIRMQLAREMLADGRHHTTGEIARAAGFETTAYFKKLFRETYGGLNIRQA